MSREWRFASMDGLRGSTCTVPNKSSQSPTEVPRIYRRLKLRHLIFDLPELAQSRHHKASEWCGDSLNFKLQHSILGALSPAVKDALTEVARVRYESFDIGKHTDDQLLSLLSALSKSTSLFDINGSQGSQASRTSSQKSEYKLVDEAIVNVKQVLTQHRQAMSTLKASTHTIHSFKSVVTKLDECVNTSRSLLDTFSGLTMGHLLDVARLFSSTKASGAVLKSAHCDLYAHRLWHHTSLILLPALQGVSTDFLDASGLSVPLSLMPLILIDS